MLTNRPLRPHPARLAVALLVAALAIVPTVEAATTDVLYSFTDGRAGGVALLRVDGSEGPALHRRLFTVPELARPRKLAVSEDGRHLLLADETSSSGNLILARLDPTSAEAEVTFDRLDFPTVPDEVRAVPGGFVVGGDGGNLVFVDSRRRTIAARWSSRRALDPSGHKPEDLVLLPCGERILLSFQKDSSSGRHLGSRLVTLRLPSLALVADLQLPRDRPELHIAGNVKEQGPNPEVIVLSPRTNTMLLTLDLYGGLLLADLDAIAEGRLSRPTVISADPGEAWGIAFPDRVVHFEQGGREFTVVANAGEGGGVVAVDMAARRRAAAAATIPGLDTLVHLPAVEVVAAAPAGKVKRRVGVEVEKFSEPGRDLHLIDVRHLERGEMPVVLHSMGDLTTHALPVVGESARIVVVMGRRETQRLALLEIARRDGDAIEVRELWSTPAEGEVRRATARPVGRR